MANRIFQKPKTKEYFDYYFRVLDYGYPWFIIRTGNSHAWQETAMKEENERKKKQKNATTCHVQFIRIRAWCARAQPHTKFTFIRIQYFIRVAVSHQITPHAHLAGTKRKITFNINWIPPISRNFRIIEIINEGTNHTFIYFFARVLILPGRKTNLLAHILEDWMILLIRNMNIDSTFLILIRFIHFILYFAASLEVVSCVARATSWKLLRSATNEYTICRYRP